MLVCDNIDWEEKVHDMRSDHQNKSVHAVATTLVFNRVSSDHLPDNGPQNVLKETDLTKIVELTTDVTECRRARYRTIIAQHLKEHFSEFKSIRKYVPIKSDCPYQDEMSQQSHVITFPVLMKDKKKCSLCVDVLDTFEDWVHTLYSIPQSTDSTPDETSSTGDSFLPGSTFITRPDQPGSHIPPTAHTDDVLTGVRIPCYGDQLTRVRLAGAKDLRAGCHSPRQRIDHIYPYRILDWHSKRFLFDFS